MKTSDRCPKCGDAMETGFLLELGHSVPRSVTQWMPGTPEKSIWMGLKLGGRTRLDVQTYRCTGCGFLESYAR